MIAKWAQEDVETLDNLLNNNNNNNYATLKIIDVGLFLFLFY